MRELVYLSRGKLEWRDVPEPKIDGSGQALVRPIAVATCDLDVALLRGSAPMFGGNFPLGHESIAQVIEVSDDVEAIKSGDLVVPAFQICCGMCARCSRGLTGSCERVRGTAMFGIGTLGGNFGGALSDVMKIPYARGMLVPLPDGVAPANVASASDNVADAWRTVAPQLEANPHSPVLIVGSGSIGLYAIQIALACGSSRVDYVDGDNGRRSLAQALGAHAREGPAPKRLGPYPITVAACSDAEGLLCAIRSTEPGGTCTSVGIFPGETAMPLFEMYVSGIAFFTGRVHSKAVIPKVLQMVTSGQIQPDRVTSKIVRWADAIDALSDPPTKLVITRD